MRWIVTLAVLCAVVIATASALEIGGGRLRNHKLRRKNRAVAHATFGVSAEDARHNARADKMVEEIENGGSSLLDAMERSVDEKLKSTKDELDKVTDFRKRAMKLLQSKLADLAAGDDKAAAAQVRAVIAQGNAIDASRAAPHAGAASAVESDSETEPLTDSGAGAGAEEKEAGAGGAGGIAGLHPDPINELLSLDQQEVEARTAIDAATERFQSMRVEAAEAAGGEAGAGAEAGAEEQSAEAIDAEMEESTAELRANLTALQQQRTELFHHVRLHPERLLRIDSPAAAANTKHNIAKAASAAQRRAAQLYDDLERLKNEAAIDSVYAAAAANGGTDGAATTDSALAFGSKQSLMSWIALIEAELADSAAH